MLDSFLSSAASSAASSFASGFFGSGANWFTDSLVNIFSGAIAGAAVSALTGGEWERGAMGGALSGAVSTALGDTGMDLNEDLVAAVAGAAGGAVIADDALMGALSGGVGGLLSSMATGDADAASADTANASLASEQPGDTGGLLSDGGSSLVNPGDDFFNLGADPGQPAATTTTANPAPGQDAGRTNYLDSLRDMFSDKDRQGWLAILGQGVTGLASGAAAEEAARIKAENDRQLAEQKAESDLRSQRERLEAEERVAADRNATTLANTRLSGANRLAELSAQTDERTRLNRYNLSGFGRASA
jgi:hypothetical protein